MSANLLVDREGRLLRLTLNRPEKRNALNLALCRELVDTMEQAGRDKTVGAILLQGAGPVFCSGMDLAEALEAEARGQIEAHEKLFTVGTRMRKPVVAAVQGVALAGGLGLVTNAHVVVAADDATFGLTEIRIGMWPFVVYRSVAAAAGERRALELALTGRTFTAAEALAFGLVHMAVPSAALASRAARIASGLAAASPEAVELGLEFVEQTRGLSREQAGELARKFRARAFQSSDFREGVAAFKEKRPPRWPSMG